MRRAADLLQEVARVLDVRRLALPERARHFRRGLCGLLSAVMAARAIGDNDEHAAAVRARPRAEAILLLALRTEALRGYELPGHAERGDGRLRGRLHDADGEVV